MSIDSKRASKRNSGLKEDKVISFADDESDRDPSKPRRSMVDKVKKKLSIADSNRTRAKSEDFQEKQPKRVASIRMDVPAPDVPEGATSGSDGDEHRRLGRPHKHKNGKRHVLNGVTIYKDHPSYDLMLNLKLGIRHSVGKITPEAPRPLLMQDFFATTDVSFPAAGSNLTPAHKASDFRFKDYAPLCFRHFREKFGIDAADYMISLCDDNALHEVSTPGKSGALFYISQDDKFIIKTISKPEAKFLQHILPSYYLHIMQNPHTLLPKFFGFHRVLTDKGRRIRIVVMNNILPTKYEIHEKFDLKGSRYGRYVTEKELSDPTVTKKDLDYIKADNTPIHLGKERKALVMRHIEADCTFLASLKIMDYSLLLGVHYLGRGDEASPTTPTPRKGSSSKKDKKEKGRGLFFWKKGQEQRNSLTENGDGIDGGDHPPRMFPFEDFGEIVDGGFASRDARKQDVIVYMGIIDVLQQYNVRKRTEYRWKRLRLPKYDISVQKPEYYAGRFQKFINNCFS